MNNEERAERDAQIYQLALRGYTPEEIAPNFRLSPSTTHEIISRVNAALHRPDPNQAKLMELDRLDKLLKKAVSVLNKKHLAHSHGRVILDPTNELKPLEDSAPALNAISTILKIQERRAKLLGLDAPTNVNIITPPDALSTELQELVNEAKARAANVEEYLAAPTLTAQIPTEEE